MQHGKFIIITGNITPKGRWRCQTSIAPDNCIGLRLQRPKIGSTCLHSYGKYSHFMHDTGRNHSCMLGGRWL